MKRQIFIVLVSTTMASVAMAQMSFEEIEKAQKASFEQYKAAQDANFNQYKAEKQAEFDAYRKRINDEYARAMEKIWPTVQTQPAEPEPVVPKVKPVVCEEPQPQQPKPQPQQIPVQEDSVVILQPVPAPEPIAPVVEPKEETYKTESVLFYGTNMGLKYPNPDGFKLAGLNEKQMALAWDQLSESRYNVLVSSALAVRKQYNLCDWGYIQYLQKALEKHYGKTNEAVFVQNYLLTQSGYRVRLAKDETRLYLLLASNYNLFNHFSTKIDGKTFFVADGNPKRIQVCPALYEKEKTVSLQIAATPKLTLQKSNQRHLQSKMGLAADITVNKNLIDFYNNYPRSYVNGDVTTTWVTYANTPLEKQTRDLLYPAIKTSIEGLNERDAVNKILNWVQTAFEYEYDDKIWGGDRAFFATETLFYPYCDCEDRSILFSRLVRDIIGDEVVLLYYPGHLATAVCFKEDVKGDYLTCQNKKFVVCDPTFIGAGVGRTMPGMNNQQAKVIVLK